MNGVRAYGVAFPRLRLASDDLRAAWGMAPRDVDERAVPAFDEDPFTLAVEAGRRALAAAGLRPEDVRTVARTYGPEGAGPWPRLADALGLPAGEVALAPCHGAALVGGLAALPGPVLAVAAAVPDAAPGAPEEGAQGAGAVALVLGEGGAPVPAAPPPARWRRAVGDLGAAQPFLDVVGALVDAKADVAGEAPEAALAGGRRVTYVRALQARGVLAAVDPLPDQPMGAYVPPATFAASIPARWRLEGARCAACERAYLPAPARCPECGGAVAPHRFAPRGRVHAATTIGRGGAPSEFAEQQRQTGEYDVAIVELEEGARAVGQVVAEAEPRALAIGDAVEPVLRRLYHQQGSWRYGLKWRKSA